MLLLYKKRYKLFHKMSMNLKTYIGVTTVLFLIIAVLHLARTIFGWEALINGWVVPLGMSWVGLAVSGFLAYAGFNLRRHV